MSIFTKLKTATDFSASVIKEGFALIWPEKSESGTISLKCKLDDGSVQEISGGGTADSVAWENVTGKPSTFPPADHTHEIANVNGLQSALDAKGTVKTVNGVEPDASGNVTIETTSVAVDESRLLPADAADQNLPVKWISSGELVTPYWGTSPEDSTNADWEVTWSKLGSGSEWKSLFNLLPYNVTLGGYSNCVFFASLPAYVQWESKNGAQCISKLKLSALGSDSSPADFSLSGSNDGQVFTPIFEKTGETWSGATVDPGDNTTMVMEYSFNNTTAYKIHRLDITARVSSDAGLCNLVGIEGYGEQSGWSGKNVEQVLSSAGISSRLLPSGIQLQPRGSWSDGALCIFRNPQDTRRVAMDFETGLLNVATNPFSGSITNTNANLTFVVSDIAKFGTHSLNCRFGDPISMQTDSSWFSARNWLISMFVRPWTGTSNESTNTSCCLIQQGDLNTLDWYVVKQSNNQVFLALLGFGESTFQGAGTNCVIQPREWSHIALARIDNSLRLFVNGVLQNEIPNSYDPRLGDLMWTISKLSFANFGHIDDVIVRELSEAEVTQYSESTIAVPESSEAGVLTSYLEPISLAALKAELAAVN